MQRIGRWWGLPALWAPAAAVLAEAAMRTLEPGTSRFWWTLGVVQVLGLFGYGCSSIPQLAGWIDPTGDVVVRLERRLKIIQGAMIALLAGNLAYYGGYYYGGVVEIGCFGAAALAAYGGDKFLSPLLQRATDLYTRIFGKPGEPQ